MKFELSLTEYSAKHKVSVSTLRRRIKKDEVPFIQEAGKYMLPDVSFDELLEADNIVPPTPKRADRGSDNAPPQENTQQTAAASFLEPLGMDLSFYSLDDESPENNDENGDHADYEEDEDLHVEYSSVNHAVSARPEELAELKKAYTAVLGEKEEQILHLKQHIADLQTLNKVLESEVDRLQVLQSDDNLGSLKTSFMKHTF